MTRPTSDRIALFQTLVEIVQQLRGPNGCPWDKEQTQRSLTQYAIEEAHELAEAIESNNQSEIRDELGDFLFQVILQAQVAEDLGHFDLADVIESLNQKMLRRHPHVFGNDNEEDIQKIWQKWEQIKRAEKSSDKKPSIFNLPKNLPALQSASKIGRKTANWKFDWENAQQVFDKILEEIQELREVIESNTEDIEKIEHEVGDVLFSVAQLARHHNLDPEACLRVANKRFQNRFEKMLEISECFDSNEFSVKSNKEKNDLWNQAKEQCKDQESKIMNRNHK